MLSKISLKGEQKRILFLSPKGAVLIKGVAGSGKTTIAIYRAKHLLETYSNLFEEPNVFIFTFNKTLAYYIQSLLRELNLTAINVTNFHKWAYRFLKSRGIDLYGKIIGEPEKIQAIENIKENISHKIADKSAEFFAEEFSWIKGKLFESEDEYVDAIRIGRGNTDRLRKEDKKIVWQLFQEYQNYLKENDKVDFDDFAILTLKEIEKNPRNIPIYSHIIIDEAQDLNKAQILTLSKLVSPNTESITIIADAAQKIYKSGFTWREVGINIRGRTVELKKNYRNNEYIAKLASSLLDSEPDFLKAEYTSIEYANEGGEKPKLFMFDGKSEMYQQLITNIKNRLTSRYIIAQELFGYKTNIVVLHRTNEGIKELQEILEKNGIKTEIIRNSQIKDINKIKLCTMSSIKGLEFDIVHIVDVNDDLLPYKKISTDEDDILHISTERRLLYTCITRAKQNLYLYTSGEPSRFIDEFDTNYIDIIDKRQYLNLSSVPIKIV